MKRLINSDKIEAYHLVVLTDLEPVALYGNKLFDFDDVIFISFTGNAEKYDWSGLYDCEIVVWCDDFDVDFVKLIQGGRLSYLQAEIDILNAEPDVVLRNILALRKDEKPEVAVQVTNDIKVHGLVGELADWMTRTAWRPQPKLSLSAALVLVGALKGRKYIGPKGIYSNLYVFNIATTAGGKDRLHVAIKSIMFRLKAVGMVLHAPASGPGFIDGLAAAGGHGLCIIDEMGDYVLGANNKNNGGHQAKVLKYWMEAFTSTKTYLDGEQRADGANMKPKRIEKPLFCMLGSSNPDKLTKAFQGSDLSSGLLNRFLFVQALGRPRKRNGDEFDSNEMLPEFIFEKFKEYLKPAVEGSDPYGMEDEPKEVAYSKDAEKLYNQVNSYFEDKLQECDANDRLADLYGRAHEYTGKVALILSDDKEITLQDMQVAYEIVKESVATAVSFCGDIADTREEEDYLRVKNIIKKSKKITAGALCHMTQRIQGGARRRNEILDTLIEIGLIAKEEHKTSGRPNITYFWK